MIKATVSKWGNSLAIRIPQALAELLGLTEGTSVDLDAVQNTLLVKKHKDLRLEELLATYEQRQTEENWGGPEGQEVW